LFYIFYGLYSGVADLLVSWVYRILHGFPWPFHANVTGLRDGQQWKRC